MATIIRIKRSSTVNAPTSLKTGELAYSDNYTDVATNGPAGSNTGGRLYYGAGGSDDANTIEIIGGQYYTDLLSATPGTIQGNKAVLVDANKKVNEFLVDDLTLDGSSITVTASNTALTLSPNGTAAVNVPAGYKDRSGFGTNSLVTKEYVDVVAGATTLTFQGDSSSSSTVDLDSQTLTVVGGTSIGTRVSGQTITVELDPTGVSAGSFGSATSIPVLSVNAQGQITSATTASVASTLNLAGDGATTGDVALLDSSLEIAGGANITTTVTDNTVTVALDTAVSGLTELTVDNIKIDGSTIQTTAGNNTMYINPYPLGDSGDVVILGNLTVEGTTTTVNSTTVSLNDVNIVLADSAQNAAEANGAGLTVNGANATITYDASTDRWDFNKDIEVTNVYANVTGDITGDIDADSGDIRTLTSNIATINTISTSDLTADSAEIGNLTGTTAQFDTSVTTGQLNVDNLRLDGNIISSTSGDIILSPASSLRLTGLTDTRIPFSTDNSGTITSSSNFTFNDVTSTFTVTGLISTDNATIDSAEIGNLTGTTAQFDTSVTTATVNATTVDTTNLQADSASILGDIRITGSFIDITTDELTEGSSNLYYTTNRVDSDMGDILLAGEGIDITDGAGTYTISGEDATITNKGIASFGGYADSAGAAAPGNQRQFELTGGDVRIAIIDGGTY